MYFNFYFLYFLHFNFNVNEINARDKIYNFDVLQHYILVQIWASLKRQMFPAVRNGSVKREREAKFFWTRQTRNKKSTLRRMTLYV